MGENLHNLIFGCGNGNCIVTGGCMDRDCSRIGEILEAIKKDFPNIEDDAICELADINRRKLQNWRKTGTARSKDVCRLVNNIGSMPENWDGKIFEAGDCMGSSFNK